MSTYRIIRVVLLSAITIMNLASTSLECIALTFGSGGRYEAILMGLHGFASLLPAAYWLQKIVFENDYLIIRTLSTFGLLSVISFVSTMIIIVRNDMLDGKGLIQDYSLLDHSVDISRAIIALAVINTFFSIMGVLISYIDWISQREIPRIPTQPVCRQSNSISSRWIPQWGDRNENGNGIVNVNMIERRVEEVDTKSIESTSTLVHGVDFDIKLKGL